MRIDAYLITQLLLILISVCFRLYNDYWYFKYDTNVTSNFLNVGNGDSILTKLSNGQVLLVDFGTDNSASYYLGRLLPFWKKDLDYVILSHPHADHLGSALQLLNEYNFDCFIYDNGFKEVNSVERELRLKLKGSVIVQPENGVELYKLCTKKDETEVYEEDLLSMTNTPNISDEALLGVRSEDPSMLASGVTLFYYGNKFKVKDVTKNPNLRSVIVLIKHNNSNLFLMGDAEETVQDFLFKDLLANENHFVSSFNIIKVPHQGARDAINEQILHLLRPKLAIFSVGKNSYGHPHSETLKYYKDLGSNIFRTDERKGVSITISNGKIYVN